MKKQAGFTLVEIAIVLVIIGLLLGGVLKGQELINSAKVKNFASDFRTIPTFIYAYQDRFRALPGDDQRVAVNLPAGATAATTPVNTPPTLGNARINGNWNSTTATDESVLFWQHVRLAGLATGTPDVTQAAYFPLNADGGRIGITGDPVFTGTPVWSANFFVCASGIQGRFARQLDVTIDDGNTGTGSIRVLGTATGGELASSGTFYTVTPADDAVLYTVCSAN
jgi:prepilin-type N-terminal cleavage/methylation domain-containing protein